MSVFLNYFWTQNLTPKFRTCSGNSGRMATLFYINGCVFLFSFIAMIKFVRFYLPTPHTSQNSSNHCIVLNYYVFVSHILNSWQ